MENPVNLDSLREITGGDAELEAALFHAFLEGAIGCIDKLNAAAIDGDEKSWREQSHAFKGICANLGAQPLAELCEIAEKSNHLTSEERKRQLDAIKSEFLRLRAALE